MRAITFHGTLIEVGHFDKQDGMIVQLEGGRELCFQMTAAETQKVGKYLYQPVTVTVEVVEQAEEDT